MIYNDARKLGATWMRHSRFKQEEASWMKAILEPVTSRRSSLKHGPTMPLELKKIDAVALRSVGLDEKWLQDRIKDDPALLGLGDLEIAGREHQQPLGGRIDFLMRDAETETYYEVEIMLGALDESHVIRTIEYWDVERQRRPQYDHRAVIVAEQITSRFFNVLRLLNRSVPMIAVQLSAFRLDDNTIVLHPVTVLDVVEEIADSDVVDQAEQTDRSFWERKAAPASLAVMDKIVSSLRAAGIEPKLTYNRHHIAMGTTGYNFCWFNPRKTVGYCHIVFRAGSETREAALSTLQAQGFDATPRRAENVSFSVTTKGLDEHSATIIGLLKSAENSTSK
jgi:hypothetical protein